MKELLVAFDFSKNALHTLEYALLYANTLGNRHSFGLGLTMPAHLIRWWILSRLYALRQKKYFDEIVTKYQPQLKHGKIQVHLRKGKVYSEIAMLAKQIKADVVFAGTHGVSGYERFWIGSNAYRIVTSSPCPVITLRTDYGFNKSIKRILVPIDSSAESRQNYLLQPLWQRLLVPKFIWFCFIIVRLVLSGPGWKLRLKKL